jgi:hypothetical protein
MPSQARIAVLKEDCIRGAFANFLNVSNLLTFRLLLPAGISAINITVMPEIFADFNNVLMVRPGDMHPLVGFLALVLIDNIFPRNPLGTVYPTMEKLITYIQSIPGECANHLP